jgi:hypothetical protein
MRTTLYRRQRVYLQAKPTAKAVDINKKKKKKKGELCLLSRDIILISHILSMC